MLSISQTKHLDALLESLGIKPTATVRQQALVLLQALDLFAKRDQQYAGVWQQYGALSNLVRSATKVDRLMQVWWHAPDGAKALHKDGLDDAYDMINYMTFFIRCARDGNLNGQPQMRIASPLPSLRGGHGMTDTD